MTKSTWRLIAASALIAAAAPGVAQEVQVGPGRYAVTLRDADMRAATPRAAHRTLARIERAALAVCGASSFSLYAVKLAVGQSACWRDAVADALHRIDDPLLAQAFRDRHRSDAAL